MTMRKVLAAGLVVMGITVPAAAQNVHISKLYEQVLANGEIMGAGFVLDAFSIQPVYAEQSIRLELNVPRNASMTLMGDCDDDCADMDMKVYNGAGKQLGEDVLADPYPIVAFTSDDTGRVALDLIMNACSTQFCYASYSLFVATGQ